MGPQCSTCTYSMNVLSLGAGVQSTALAILNAEGKVEPRASVAIFADTGGEMPQTYAHLWRLADFLGDRLPIQVVRYEPNLEQAIPTKHYPLVPAYHEGGGGLPRICTTRWKIQPINRWVRSQGVRQMRIQIGISVDEVHRIKPAKEKWVERCWPLVDMRLNREDCRRLIADARLLVPSPSACFFCPLRPQAWWAVLAADFPAHFERACQIEEALPAKDGWYHLSRLGELRASIGRQGSLFGEEAAECEGYCFT